MANQGGSHEQHVKAGEQSHKNTDGKQQQKGGASSGTKSGAQQKSSGKK